MSLTQCVAIALLKFYYLPTGYVHFSNIILICYSDVHTRKITFFKFYQYISQTNISDKQQSAVLV